MAIDQDSWLRANSARLRDALDERIGGHVDGDPDEDGHTLVAALCAEEPTQLLTQFEASARALAQRGGLLGGRMEAIHRRMEAMGRGLDEVFADDVSARAAARARLTWLVAEVDGALVRGYQAVAERRFDDEARRAGRGLGHVVALQRINAAANSTMDLAEVLQTTASAVAENLGADLCAIFLFDELARELQLRATNGPRPQSGPRYTLMLGEGYTGSVAEHGHPLRMRDATVDPQFARECGAYAETYHGLLAMPIIFFTVEKLVGVISVQTAEPRDFTAEESRFLEVVAGQLAMYIENGRLYEQTDETLRRKVHELSTLHRVSALVTSTIELKGVLEIIVEQAVQLSGADRSIIFELDRATSRLRPVAVYGFPSAVVARPGLEPGQCCAGRAVRSGEPSLQVDCMRGDAGCFFRDHLDTTEDLHSALCVPLVSTHGALGALCVYSAQRHLFSHHQLQLVVTFANVAAMAMENARLFEQTREGLKIKGILLREMHHRVKNNLQQVASILSMQRRRAKAPQAERILAESIGRIQGIAATHDLLSRENLGVASVDDIARKIVGIVRGNLVPPHLRLDLAVEPCSAHVPSEQATTLAIALNELIANAIEHGFAGQTRGHIRVSGRRDGEMIVVRVADDGEGPPPGFDLEKQDGLGLQVVRSLVGSDLHGSFEIARVATADSPLAGEVATGTGGGGVAGTASDAPTTRGGAAEHGWTVAELRFPAMLVDDKEGGVGEIGEDATLARAREPA